MIVRSFAGVRMRYVPLLAASYDFTTPGRSARPTLIDSEAKENWFNLQYGELPRLDEEDGRKHEGKAGSKHCQGCKHESTEDLRSRSISKCSAFVPRECLTSMRSHRLTVRRNVSKAQLNAGGERVCKPPAIYAGTPFCHRWKADRCIPDQVTRKGSPKKR